MKPILIYSKHSSNVYDKLPITPNKSKIVHDLILSNFDILIEAPIPCSKRDLLSFHTKEYLEELEEEEFEGVIEYCKYVVGGTFSSCRFLKQPRIVFNFDGGRHHAQADASSGFCYVNDIIITLQYMKKRVFYLDLDIHHSDAVSDAFYFTDRVCCMSFHMHEVGYFPGTGSIDEIGEGKGKYFNINVPLKRGLSNFDLVEELVPLAIEKYKPEILVVVAGGDILANDALGRWNLGLDCVKIYDYLFGLGLATLVLGGGGYNIANTSKYYASIVKIAMQNEVDVSTHICEYFDVYKDEPEMVIPRLAGLIDENTDSYISQIRSQIKEQISHLF